MGAMATGRARAAPLPPRLRAAGFVSLKALWFALLALAVVAPIAGAWQREAYRERVFRPFERVGLPFGTAEGMVRLARPYTEEGVRSGIVPGDRILAIEGRAVSDDPASVPTIAALLHGPEGSRVRIRTRSADGAERDHILTRSQATVDRDYAKSGISYETQRATILTIELLTALCLIGAAVLLFRRRSRDRLPVLLSLSLLLVSATLQITGSFYGGLALQRASDLLNTVGWGLLVLALLLFPDGRFAQRWAPGVALLYIPVGLAMHLYLWAFLTTWFFLGLLVAALASLLLRYRRLPVGPERQQLRWALLGFAAGTAATGVAYSLMSLNLYLEFDPLWIWSTLVATTSYSLAYICFAAGLLVSLLKYRLYDAEAVISRSAGYAVLTVMLGATFAATAKAMEVVFETYLSGGAGAWPGIIGAGLAVTLITPLHGRVHAWAERRFQKGLLHLRRDLPLCVGDLRETASLDELLAEIVERIARGVRAGRVAVLLDGKVAAGLGLEAGAAAIPDLPDGPSEMSVDREDRCFPLRIPLRSGHRADDAPVGWLLLGPRPDGSLYGKDELDALREIEDPVARAVRIVQLREARERVSDSRADRQDRRIRALEKAIRALTSPPANVPA